MRSKKDKNHPTAHISLVIERTLWERFLELANQNDVSANWIINRLIVITVNEGRIPWPTTPAQPVTVTPTYDHETVKPVKEVRSGRKGPVTPAA